MTEINPTACRFYNNGTCRYGENCKFKHTDLSCQREAAVPISTEKNKIQKSSMMNKYFIGDELLDFTGIPSQESSRVPPPLDTDQLRKKKCRNRTSAVKRRASASSDAQPTKRLSIHSPNDIPYLNYVKFIPLDSRAKVLLSFFNIQQKSLQLCEAYFDNKIIFDNQDRASAERDGYSEAEIHEDPYFHKYIRPLTVNERMDWGLMFNEDVRLRQKFSTTVYCRQSSFTFQNLGARDSVMIDLSAYKTLYSSASSKVLPPPTSVEDSENGSIIDYEEVDYYCLSARHDSDDNEDDDEDESLLTDFYSDEDEDSDGNFEY
jgi:hypothetical protein